MNREQFKYSIIQQIKDRDMAVLLSMCRSDMRNPSLVIRKHPQYLDEVKYYSPETSLVVTFQKCESEDDDLNIQVSFQDAENVNAAEIMKLPVMNNDFEVKIRREEILLLNGSIEFTHWIYHISFYNDMITLEKQRQSNVSLTFDVVKKKFLNNEMWVKQAIEEWNGYTTDNEYRYVDFVAEPRHEDGLYNLFHAVSGKISNDLKDELFNLIVQRNYLYNNESPMMKIVKYLYSRYGSGL